MSSEDRGLHDAKLRFGRFSPLLLARIVGIVGLWNRDRSFDIGYVHSKLMVAVQSCGDTSQHPGAPDLFRSGLLRPISSNRREHIGEMISFYLFRRVNLIVAAISLCAGVVGIAVEAGALLIAYDPVAARHRGDARAHSLRNNCMPSLTSHRIPAGGNDLPIARPSVDQGGNYATFT